ncbi:MAG: hypothetical protein JXQ66_05065 [Campylobacterales bacterium]|nr:hypothetical protein [Campylobacterales bacterium]
MRKTIILVLILSSCIYSDSFEKNCQKCHFQERQLQMFMSRYTLKYSNEDDIKKAIFYYLKAPKIEDSVMPSGFLNRWGLKESSTLEDRELKKSIDDYYNRYNLIKLLN